MKIFDKSFVGIDHTREDITIAPLAFLTPYEDNAAGKKRRESVRSWLRGWHWNDDTKQDKTETRIVENKPRAGFTIVDFAERWSTSNKFARVYDPEGYELEISMANLIDILVHGKVEKGVIQGEMIWAREGAHNRLIPVDSELFKGALREGQVLEAEIGDKVIGNHGKEYIYLGRGYIQPVVAVGEETSRLPTEDDHYWLRAQGEKIYEMPVRDRLVTQRAEGKSSHVYMMIEQRRSWQDKQLVTRQKPMKITANFGPSDDVPGDNTVCNTSGVHYSAAGSFAAGRMLGRWGEDNGDPHRYYTRSGIFRHEPFDADDLDFDVVMSQLQDED